MPDFADFEIEDAAPITDLNNATAGQIKQGAQAVTTKDYGAFTTLAGDAALGTIDLVDTVASSLPGFARFTGTKRGDVNAKMLAAIDMPGVSEFYSRNKEGIALASTVYGVIGAELATRKIAKVGAPFMNGLKTLPYARRIATLDEQYNVAMGALRVADSNIAAKGLIGARQLIEATSVPAATWTGKGLETSMQILGRNTLATQARRLGAAKGIRGALASEITLAATQNQNDILFSEDYGQNALWSTLGILGGGVFGNLTTNYAIKKFVNSDSLARLRSEAMDPTGLEERAFRGIGKAKNPDVYLGNLQGTRTDRVTALMTIADATPNAGVDISTFSQMSTQRMSAAFTEMEKVAQKRVLGIDGTNFIIGRGKETTPEGQALKSALRHDAGAMYGTEMIAKVPDGHTLDSLHIEKNTKVKQRISAIQQQLDDPNTEESLMPALLGEMKQLKFNDRLVPLVLADDELLPMAHGSVYDNWEAPVIRENKLGDDSIWEAYNAGGKAEGLSIDANLNIFLSKKRTIEQLDFLDSMKLFRLARKATLGLTSKALKDPKFRLELPRNPHWLQLDMAEQLAEATNGQANIYWGQGLTREGAQVEAFAQKVDAIGALHADELDSQLPMLRTRYNLPRLTAYQMGVLGESKTPLDILLGGAIAQGRNGEAIRQMSLGDLRQGFVEARRISDLSQMSARDVKSLQGTSFNYLLDPDGNETKPLLVYKRSLRPHQWTREDLSDRIIASKIQQSKVLLGPQSGPMTQQLTASLLGSPDLALAGRVEGLADVQLTPALPGMGNVAPQSATGVALNSFVTGEWRARDNPAMLAVTRLRETVDRFTRGWMKDLFDGAFGDSLSTLAGPRSLQTRTLLDQFHTPGVVSGWDLLPDTTKFKSGEQDLYGFILDDTAKNRTRFEKQFGRPMEKGQQLLSPTGVPVALDDMGLQIQQSYNSLTATQRVEKNSLLRAQGLPEIHHTEWYVSPPNLEGKFVAFTQGVDGKIVPGGTVIAKTQAQLDSAIAKMRADPDSVLNRPGNIIRGRKEIEDFGSLWDRAQMEMVDANTTVIQGGKQNVGSTAAPYTQYGSFQDSLRTARDNFLNHGTDLIETLLSDQIKGAKQRSHLAVGETKSRSSFFKDVQFRSVYDYWLQEVYGRSPLASTGSLVGQIFNPIENAFNRVMQERAPGASAVWHATTDWLTKRFPWSQEVVDTENFEKLATHLGEHMPYKDAAEMLESRGANSDAWTLAQITGAGNRFTAAWMLRMLETAHPIMNLSGIINTMPSVVSHYMPKAGETVLEHAQRVGHSASIFQTPNGMTMGIADMGKLAQRGFKRAWNRASEVDFDYMKRNGFLSQEVAEFQRQFNAVETPGAFKKFLESGVDAVSILSDKSEDFSRSWAHMIGVEMAEQMGISQMAAKHNFAHDIANKMIANYSPHNRPEIFQGAIGAPIGLFQSFMYNYWQRMFRYVESGDMRSLGVQYTMQGGLFGVKTIPGFNEANALFFSAGEGESSPYDALVHKFGPSAGDLLMAGSLSNLPKIFGQEGVDLYSRGDTSARLPLVQGIDQLPVTSVIKKVYEGLGQAADLFSSQNPQLTMNQIGEVLSNMIPNRPMAGWAEILLAGGKDTDTAGQLVSESHGMMESVYRMMGLRSIRQSKELEAYYSNKQAMEIKSGQDEALRISSRMLMRNGGEEALPLIFENYVQNGGDARHFRRWYKDNMESAIVTRGTRQLDDVMSDPDKMFMVERLMDAEVGIAESDNTADPFDTYSVADPMDDPIQPTSSEDDPGYKYGIPPAEATESELP